MDSIFKNGKSEQAKNGSDMVKVLVLHERVRAA